MSLAGSAGGLVILLLRRLKGLPRPGVYFLWLFPFLRFVLPFGLSGQLSIVSLMTGFSAKSLTADPWGLPSHITLMNSIQAAESYFPVTYRTPLLSKWFFICSILWMVVLLSALALMTFLYIRSRLDFKRASHLSENIYTVPSLASPVVYGVLQPKILIPEKYPHGDLEYILMHERVHIKRKDNLVRLLVLATACVHWFNPLMWLFVKHLFEDMELACDTGVLKKLEPEKRKEYASALLNSATKHSFLVPSFGGSRVRSRIENVLTYRGLTFLSLTVFFLIALLTALLLLTNPALA